MSKTSNYTRVCLELFEELCLHVRSKKRVSPSQISVLTLEDEIGRFKICLGNLGALQNGHDSLDHRLQKHSLMRENVLKLIAELSSELTQAIEVVSGKRLPFEEQRAGGDKDDGDDEKTEDDDSQCSSLMDEKIGIRPTTELRQRFLDIVRIIDFLYKLSWKLWNLDSVSRSMKSTLSKEIDPEYGTEELLVISSQSDDASLSAESALHDAPMAYLLSFLFRIDSLEPIFDLPPQPNVYGWDPPHGGQLPWRPQTTLFRWAEGVVTPIQHYEPECNMTLIPYSCASVYTSFPENRHQFLAVNVDITKTEFTQWYPVGFHHLPLEGHGTMRYSELDFAGEYGHLAALDRSPDNWLSNLFSDHVQYRPIGDQTPTSAGIIGRLPLLLAMAAFSADEEHLQDVLLHSLQNVRGQRRWIPHSLGNGLRKYRGMVVSIYLDPRGVADRNVLNDLEAGHHGPFFSP